MIIRMSGMLTSFLFLVSCLIVQASLEDALYYTTRFYGAQRSGTLDQNWILDQYPVNHSGSIAARGICFPEGIVF